ncbi:hypothetical protein [Streptomyces sp. NRRL WC-3742]|uniref:hypothetical protein n=1 Tax=Streptomyces sp. NRRL WC-3742 TaxID=1463934 RepID=UPI0004C745F8|nr:hypothetical protein [Streptomyces sp. NRRL WC-3742]
MTTTASHSATPPHRRPALGGHGGVPEGGLRPAAGPEGALPAGVGPWSVRCVRPNRGRAALELYQDGELADVLVAARLTSQLLRGARRCPSTSGGPRAARSWQALAWGRLPADGAVPAVEFTGRRRFRSAPVAVAAEVVTVAGEFWLAWAQGPVGAVVVRVAEAGVAERLPLERVRGVQGAPVGGAR